MRLAKADNEDFEGMLAFMNACELTLERERFSLNSPEDNWEDLDDEDEDKELMMRIKKRLLEEEGIDDNRVVCYEFLRKKFSASSSAWRRIYWGASALIDFACDPTESHLALHPCFEFTHVAPEM